MCVCENYLDVYKRQIICRKLKDGCKRADVYVNPREVSKAVGNKRCNIIKLKQERCV